ncbi:MAG TPA: DEAD/DEAH box helicase, partial [Nitrospirae bacterium]|nr:DEAD/DEAH box helicase [Nitrospirota bacterium]
MIFETPEDTFKAYQRFLKKGQFKKAYRCLEKMLHEFPDDEELLDNIVDLCLVFWENPKMARPWLQKLVTMRTFWVDYTSLSQVEAALENITKAKEYLKTARSLQKKQTWKIHPKENPKKVFAGIADFIKFKEWNLLAKQDIKMKTDVMTTDTEVRFKKETKINVHNKVKKPPAKVVPADTVKAAPSPAPEPIPAHTIPVKITPFNEEKFRPFIDGVKSTLNECRLLTDYMQMSVRSGFDELLCIDAMTGIEKYWYQVETVKKVLKQFHGRALLCDEVGLGKTIEAGMLIKEYLMRGMIKNVLILAPASLVSQWKEEMLSKFHIEFLTTDDVEFQADSRGFWKNRFIIASINTAKSSKNTPAVIEQFYDLVVVDEAHHLRNRRTLSWKLVNRIKKKFIFLLSATPVQNNLIELFNLITLLKPGQFKTEKLFKQEYVKRGNQKVPANKEKLRELLRDVMIRNTRSAIDLKLPKRFATTIRVEPTDIERKVYGIISGYLRRDDLKKPVINLLLKEAGSSPFALKKSLMKIIPSDKGGELKDIIDALNDTGDISKGKALLEILMKNPREKKIIFTQYIKTMDYITELLARERIPYVTFSGSMNMKQKDAAIARFRDDMPVLVSTESGGEGRNMQFCNTIINFDLPWNPMKIEQRIGRLHRIGQTRDVFIFNLSVKDTLENYIIDILDSKINMFE